MPHEPPHAQRPDPTLLVEYPQERARHDAWERDYRRTEAEFNALNDDTFWKQWGMA